MRPLSGVRGMQGKSLYLIIGAVVAAALAFFVAQSRAPDTELATEQPLIPGLADALNDVSRVVITGPGNEVQITLARGDERWSVEERGGYTADTADIRKMLMELGDAQLVEQKTSREDNYPALGVEAISNENAGGVQVAVEGVGDASPVIIGKSARGAGAVYVRRADEAVSWATNKRLRIERDPAEWLVKDLVDVNASRVQSVRIEHPDGEVLRVTRGAVNFEVADLPDDATLTSPTAANGLADVFDDLKFEDVTPVASFDPGEAPETAVNYVTSHGLSLSAKTLAADGRYYLTLRAEAVPVDPAQFGNDAPAEGADGAPAPSPEDKAAAMFEAMTNESAKINARVDGWVYTIPLFKYEQLTKRVGDLVDSGDDEMGPN